MPTLAVLATDDLIYPSRATASEAIAGLERVLGAAAVLVYDRVFAEELYAACVEARLDFAIAYAHCANETDFFRDSDFTKRANPAGIGITGEDGKLGPVFATYRQAARFYVALLLIKINRGDVSKVGRFAAERETAPDTFDGTVTYAKMRGENAFPVVRELDDLRKRFGPIGGAGVPRECVWMCDQNAAVHIGQKAAAIFPNLAKQVDNPTAPPVPTKPTPPSERPAGVKVIKQFVPRGRRNRPGTKMRAGELWFVVHESGNESEGADAESQMAWIVSNPATATTYVASYHGAVDGGRRGTTEPGVFYQTLPFDEIGYHAADGCDDPVNDYGCFRGLAIEGCVPRDGDEGRMRRNYAEIIGRIAAGDPAFDWGDGSTRGRFSVDRITQHFKVSDNGPNKHDCPQHMRNQAGAWAAFVAECKRQYLIWRDVFAGTYVEYPTTKKQIKAAGVMTYGGNLEPITLRPAKARRVVFVHGTTGRTYPDREAPASRKHPYSYYADPKKTYAFPFEATVDGEEWRASGSGVYVLAKNVRAA